MTKDEAKKEVQRIVLEAERLLEDAGKLMDEHQFSASFMDTEYIPRNMEFTKDDPDDYYGQAKGDGLSHFYFEDSDYKHFAGRWLSSSRYRGC